MGRKYHYDNDNSIYIGKFNGMSSVDNKTIQKYLNISKNIYIFQI